MIGVVSEIQFLGVDNTIEIWGKNQLNETLVTPEDFGVEIQRIMSGED